MNYQLLPTTSEENEKGQQMRIQMLILRFKGLKLCMMDPLPLNGHLELVPAVACS